MKRFRGKSRSEKFTTDLWADFINKDVSVCFRLAAAFELRQLFSSVALARCRNDVGMDS